MATSAPSPSMEALREALSSGANASTALSAMIAAARGSSSSAAAAAASSAATSGEEKKKSSSKDKDTANPEGQDDGHEVEDEISYTPYKPTKLKYGRNHPDPVVENATLAAVTPPDITYNLAMPADIIDGGKLSNLQLEAVVYGCQRHMSE